MENNDQTESNLNNHPPGNKSRKLRNLIAILLLPLVFIIGLLLGRSQFSVRRGPETQGDAESKTESSKEAKAPVNQVRLSAEAAKRGGIEVGEVSTTAFKETLEVTGRLAINEDNAARVGTFVMGRVTRVLATVGDFVKKGQSLIYLHSHELIDARGKAAQAKAMMAEKEKALAYAKAELERAQRLLAAKAISSREQARAEANVTAAAAELELARAEFIRSSEFLEHLTVPHDSHDDIVIYAPISGVVLKRSVTLGTVVNEASELMTIANLDTLWAIAEVPQQQAALVRLGQPVEMTLPAFGDKQFTGRVVHIGEALDPQTRTAQVRCLINNPRGNLRPEMYATISISDSIAGAGEKVIALPREAVQDVQGERVVFLALGDGLFEKKPVQTGREKGEMIEIIGGLQTGQRVVTRGGFFIKTAFLKGSMSEE